MNQKRLVFGLICLGFGIVMTGTFSAMLTVWSMKDLPLHRFPIGILCVTITALLFATGFIAEAFPEAKKEEPAKPEAPVNSQPSSTH